MEGTLKPCPQFVERNAATDDPEQDRRPGGCISGSHWSFEEGWELGEPGVDLGHVVPEVAGLLSDGILHWVILIWRP